ncbi:hypothetical protein HanIR_Chr15g0784201 [Helianthus annuus]|nr:hypothetical protein HanIR_Chr15g0784201 [Helianthus annuus]
MWSSRSTRHCSPLFTRFLAILISFYLKSCTSMIYTHSFIFFTIKSHFFTVKSSDLSRSKVMSSWSS